MTDAVSEQDLLDCVVREGVPRNSTNTRAVPETDTGGWDEYSKALGRTRLKELGKIVP
jgi:hypothetical protein